MTDNERRKAAFAEATARSRLMLNDEACSEAVAAELARRDDGFSRSVGPKQERVPHTDNVSIKRKLTDAESLRWKNYIDGTINAAVAAELAEIRMRADASVVATGKALGMIRAQLREEIAAEVGSLRADLTVEKAHADGTVVELPKFIGKRHDAA